MAASTIRQIHSIISAALTAASANGKPRPSEQASVTQDDPLQDAVTNTTAPRPPAPESRRPPTGPVQRPDERVTEHVTKHVARQHTKQQRRPQPIDPDTVRLERSADYDVLVITGTWHVVAGADRTDANPAIPAAEGGQADSR